MNYANFRLSSSDGGLASPSRKVLRSSLYRLALTFRASRAGFVRKMSSSEVKKKSEQPSLEVVTSVRYYVLSCILPLNYADEPSSRVHPD